MGRLLLIWGACWLLSPLQAALRSRRQTTGSTQSGSRRTDARNVTTPGIPLEVFIA